MYNALIMNVQKKQQKYFHKMEVVRNEHADRL